MLFGFIGSAQGTRISLNIFFKFDFKAPASCKSRSFDDSRSLLIILSVVSTPKSAVRRAVSKSSYNSSLIFLPLIMASRPYEIFSLVRFSRSKKESFVLTWDSLVLFLGCVSGLRFRCFGGVKRSSDEVGSSIDDDLFSEAVVLNTSISEIILFS